MSRVQRQQLFDNTARALAGAREDVPQRRILYCVLVQLGGALAALSGG